MHVLIVDDDSNIRDLVILLLNSKYKDLVFTEALNAFEAISYLKGNTTDLIVSDFEMPGGNGDELVKYLCESKYTGLYPVSYTHLTLPTIE